MDFRMPDMNGIEAAEQIKESLPETQVILLSAYEDAILQTDAKAAGASSWLVKGSPAPLILESIEQAWEAKKGFEE
jgi:CheY-like chemotaxis protein